MKKYKQKVNNRSNNENKPLDTDNYFSTHGRAGQSVNKPLAKEKWVATCSDPSVPDSKCKVWLVDPRILEGEKPQNFTDDDFYNPTPRTMEEILKVHLYDNYTDKQYELCANAIREWIKGKIEGITVMPHTIKGTTIDLVSLTDVLKVLGGE